MLLPLPSTRPSSARHHPLLGVVRGTLLLECVCSGFALRFLLLRALDCARIKVRSLSLGRDAKHVSSGLTLLHSEIAQSRATERR